MEEYIRRKRGRLTHLPDTAKRQPLSSTGRLILSFALVILAGTAGLMAPFSTVDGAGLSAVDALFISTSAVCVTGLSSVDVGAFLSPLGQALLLLLVQVGGLGYLTFSTGLLLSFGGRSSLLSREAVASSFTSRGSGGLVRLLRTIFLSTIVLEAIGALVLTLRFTQLPGYTWGRAAWAGVFHSVSAFCNAGFSIFSKQPGHEGFENLTFFVADPVVNVTIMVLIVCGGLGFLVLDDLVDWVRARGQRRLCLHSKITFTATVVLIFGGAALFFVLEYGRRAFQAHGTGGLLWASFFQSVTARTAGFNTLDMAAVTPAGLLLLAVLMFIGGSPASCAGGIKTTTAFILARLAWSRLRGRLHPVAFGREVGPESVARAATLTLFSIVVVALASGLVLLFEQDRPKAFSQGGPFLDLFFESVSAFATCGLSVGVTGVLGAASKLVLVAAMFVGRLGPLTVFLALSQVRTKDAVRFPDEPVLVG
jgi:trk system potassium uptake protein TrkH